ncbi:MAG: Uma2 family endonuclease [Planctomycetes bacterium]|nr:Uma2 family endonuclease [Planctomycetota bacterium]
MPLVETPKALQDQIVVLENIRWSTYVALLEDIQPGRGKRLIYDRGTLEIVVTSPLHERVKTIVGRFLEVMTLELGIDIASLGQTTWKRKDLQRGFEPDECYYVQSEPLVRGRDDIDLARDPPPDIVIEVDISRSSRRRHGVYAAFGIPEAWRFDGERLRFYELRAGRDPAGVEIERSLAFPFLARGDLDRFLALRATMSETRLVEAFRDWAREALRKG